jgi:hypothetical protein
MPVINVSVIATKGRTIVLFAPLESTACGVSELESKYSVIEPLAGVDGTDCVVPVTEYAPLVNPL